MRIMSALLTVATVRVSAAWASAIEAMQAVPSSKLNAFIRGLLFQIRAWKHLLFLLLPAYCATSVWQALQRRQWLRDKAVTALASILFCTRLTAVGCPQRHLPDLW